MAEKPLQHDEDFDRTIRDLVDLNPSDSEWPEMPDVGGKESTTINPPGSQQNEETAPGGEGDEPGPPVAPSPSFEVVEEDQAPQFTGDESNEQLMRQVIEEIRLIRDEMPGDIARALGVT